MVMDTSQISFLIELFYLIIFAFGGRKAEAAVLMAALAATEVRKASVSLSY